MENNKMKFKNISLALLATFFLATLAYAADPATKKNEKPAAAEKKKPANQLTVTGMVTYEKQYFKGQQVKVFCVMSGKKTKNEVAPSEYGKIGPFNHKMVEMEVEGTKEGGWIKITKILTIKEVKSTKVIK